MKISDLKDSLLVKVTGLFALCFLVGILASLSSAIMVSANTQKGQATQTSHFLQQEKEGQRVLLKQGLDQKVASLAELLTLIAPQPIANFDYEVLGTYVESAAKDPDIGYVRVTDTDNNLIAGNDAIPGIKHIIHDINDQGEKIASLEIGIIETRTTSAVTAMEGRLGTFQQDMAQSAFDSKNKLLAISGLIGFVILLGGIGVTFLIVRGITRPLNLAVETADNIANGKLNNEIAIVSGDETGQLLMALHSMQDKLSMVIEKDIQSIVDAARNGDLSQRVKLDEKDGFYKDLSEGINELVDVSERVITDTQRVFSALAHGDLNQQIESHYRGSFEQLKQDANATTAKIRQVIEDDIQPLIDAARNGDLSQRIEISGKSGFFKTLSSGINELVGTVDNVFLDVSNTMASLAEGDLTNPIESAYQGSFGEVKQNINITMVNLEQTVTRLRETSALINTGSEEISGGNANLSARTEQQASSLEETASAMEELTSTVRNNADNAQQANQLASNARQTAQRGGEVVAQAASAMDAINDSSRKIAEIISVIDEIAFQTNLLALNASVEAARAGEQGRGFAVVASEVRNLAGRSATAAKEIKGLINDSVNKVDTGSELVTQSGENLNEIMDSVKKVSDIVSEIAAASQEQTDGIGQVNQAVSSMDEGTQQNAALAEQTSAAAASMAEKAQEMRQLVGFFTISGEADSLRPA